MAKFRKKPVVIEATEWHKNGDHPDDYASPVASYAGHGEVNEYSADHAREHNWEGQVVRYYRRPDVPGDKLCEHCRRRMHDHGFIDTLEGGHIVCPGDWVITGVKGERYPCKPDIFAATYEPA